MKKIHKDTRFEEPYSSPRWWWNFTYHLSCFDCTHFRGARSGKIRCIAFPDGIPKELMREGAIHNKPYPGDHGIQFEEYKPEE